MSIVPLHGSVTGNTHVQILSRYAIPTMHCMFPHGDGWLQEDNAAPHKSKVAAAFHANKGFFGLLKIQILIQLRIFGLWSNKAFTSKRKNLQILMCLRNVLREHGKGFQSTSSRILLTVCQTEFKQLLQQKKALQNISHLI